MTEKFVYMFSEGNGKMKELLGGKGANLAEMTLLGLPVPQGFTVSTEACTDYYDNNRKISDKIKKQIFDGVAKLEKIMGKKFGDEADPLLVSVRSGSRASMPGMMDTILNLGLNDKAVEGLAKKTGNARFAYDSYRRFIQMFSDVVMEQPKKVYEEILDEIKHSKGYKSDLDLSTDDLKEIVALFKNNYLRQQGKEFPQEPEIQLIEAIRAVFRSWDNPRAVTYRRMHDIPYSWGTAVNVQAMVFGNKGETSGTGVAFTRNPSTGEKGLFGEFLMNAQGEDVVAGIRTPHTIDKLKEANADVFNQFLDIANKLENHYHDMQDLEFTIEEGKLYILQTRNGKRTATAALQIAVDLVNEGMISKKDAVLMIDPKQLDALLHPQFVASALKKAKPISKGLPASPGAATGVVVFTAERAVELKEKDPKIKMILARLETSPEDIEGMNVCKGILTARGGMTSHAAVVARGMGTCCVSGCADITNINEEKGTLTIAGITFKEGDYMSLDGSTGNIYQGSIETEEPQLSGNFGTVMEWADSFRSLKVRTNSDTPKDTAQAVKFGAEGIGLTRTEHMFFEADRIKAVREMIVSKTVEQRETALNKLLPMQKGDFKGIYEALNGLPATIRFLDPPLHEFVPTAENDIRELANEMKISFEELKSIIEGLHEFNPMMGHRGLRLAVTYPEIARMQTRAVIEAAIEVNAERGLNIVPEIMIPLSCELKEFKYVKNIVVATADEVIAQKGAKLDYLVGTMIEIPRACVTADQIAKEAEFFSFGTNDLTQMTFGFSRDDAAKFLNDYYEKKILESDPFVKIDESGVGELLKMAVQKGRATRPNIKLGICGEHGGDPATIQFCHIVGLDYVSCSPLRVPIARLAAAQANIRFPR